MPAKLRSRVATSVNQPPAHPATITSALVTRKIGTRNDLVMSTIQTSLAALKEGSAWVPYISPIAGLLLQALTTRDEVKQYKEECELVMRKLARVASIVVNVGEMCRKHNLKEEDLPGSLLAIMGSLQRELDEIEHVLKECSKNKGIKGLLLRKDLLTKIKRCDGELSNVLQAFQAGLALDTRFALVAGRRKVTADSDPVSDIRLGPKAAGALAISRAGPNQSSHLRFGSGPAEPLFLVESVEEWTHRRRRRRGRKSGGAKAKARENERDSMKTGTRTVAIRGSETTTRRRAS
ncbi:hypothetical protein EDB85DRAFT_1157503 [Lactarius pseudohatsudake]|nr:hypothetical protein EDB85DRAFT_1157503 [Lactarius pseudohatsudake]